MEWNGGKGEIREYLAILNNDKKAGPQGAPIRSTDVDTILDPRVHTLPAWALPELLHLSLPISSTPSTYEPPN